MIALSYSRLNQYELCPCKFKAQYIDKDYPDDSDNPNFVRGSNIHKQGENYILFKKGNRLEPPQMGVEMMNTVPIIDALFNEYPLVLPEQKLSINTKFNKCDWFDKSTMFRAILDLICIGERKAFLGDFKTGKMRKYDAKPTGQLRLAAMFTFLHHPKIEEVETAYLFVDHKKADRHCFTRDELEDMKKTFRNSFDTVNTDQEFAPKKNSYCDWCMVRPDQCPHK